MDIAQAISHDKWKEVTKLHESGHHYKKDTFVPEDFECPTKLEIKNAAEAKKSTIVFKIEKVDQSILLNKKKDYSRYSTKLNSKHIFTFYWAPRKMPPFNYCMYLRCFDQHRESTLPQPTGTIVGHNSTGDYKSDVKITLEKRAKVQFYRVKLLALEESLQGI
jgi:hypothetical protein